MTIILWCSLLLTGWNAAVGHPDPARARLLDAEPLPPIPVAVLASPDITPWVVNRVCAEADAIWAPAGITFDCHRINAEAEADTSELQVTIDDRRKEDSPAWQSALGWITFTNGSPDKSIHLSRASAADLLLGTEDVGAGTVLSNEELMGRALGRALSHELGHYLLKSKAHTPRGLMRATLSAREFFAITRRGFELTAQQRDAVVQHIREDRQCGARSPSGA
jgi:hypothetical protein